MRTYPALYGLVLAGGRSTRMGRDKGELVYHSQKQRSHAYQLLADYCEEVFVSCRAEQLTLLHESEKAILDQNLAQGPLNGLLSAHATYPDIAWLVMAVDMPFVQVSTLARLREERRPEKSASAYLVKAGAAPEPLLAIWEPSALYAAKLWVAQGRMSPRKLLLSLDIHTLVAHDSEVLSNINQQEEAQNFWKR